MAEAIGVSRDTVQDWYQGRMNPRPGVYVDLLRVAIERQLDLEKVIQDLKRNNLESQRPAIRKDLFGEDS